MIPSTVPTYCCTRPLEKSQAQSCYGEKNANITVSCDGCGGSYSGEDVIWHCPETIKDLHPNGYDLCDQCAQRQLIFDELRGLKGLKRDERYSVRVTLCYYKTTQNGIIDEVMINDIVQKLIKAETLGRAQSANQRQSMQQRQTIQPSLQQKQQQMMAPPVNIQNIPKMQNIPIIPKPNMNPSDYQIIVNALKELKLSGEYLKLFQNENVTDSDLLLLNDNDLKVLFPSSLGPRVRFRSWIKQNTPKLKMGKNRNMNIDQNKYKMINNIFKSLNIANPQQYILNFIQNGINDQMVTLLNDNDLQILIPEMSIRLLFRRYVSNKQQPASSPMQQQQQQQQMQPQSINNFLF